MLLPATLAGSLLLLASIVPPAGCSTQKPLQISSAPAYQLHLDLRRPSQGLTLEGTVHLPAQALRRETLEMTLRSDMQLADVEVLQPRASAGPVRLETGDSVAAPALATVWRLRPRRSIAAGEKVELRFRSRGGGRTTLNFHVGETVAFAGGGTTPWYPQFGGSRGVGRIEFRLPPGWRLQASGKQVPTRGRSPSLAYHLSEPTEFGFVAGPFHEHSRKFGDMQVRVLLLEKRPFADDLADVAVRTIGVLEREFGPYPYSDFAIVEVPTEPAAQSGFIGAAYTGYMLVRSDFLASTKADVGHFGHEIGHQWWGVSVQRSGDAGDYMLDEALAQYGALRAVEEISGAEAAGSFRSGKAGLGGEENGLRLIAAGFTYPLGRLPHEAAAYALSDAKGYLTYDLLSRTMGADRFRSALAEITREYRNSEVGWEEFLRRLQVHAHQDLGWFYNQWFGRKDAPIVELRWQRDTALRVTLLQRGDPYRLALPVVVEYADGSSQVHWLDTSSDSTTVALPADQPVVRLLLDPRNLVFHATVEEWNRARSLVPFTRGRLLWDHGDAAGAEAAFLGGLDSVPVPDVAGLEFLLRLHIGWIAEEAGQPDKARRQYQKAAQLAARPPEMLARLYWNFSKLARQRGDLATARWAATQVLAADAANGLPPRFTERARQALDETGGR